MDKQNKKEQRSLMLSIRGTMAGQLYEWQELRKDCFNRVRDILYRSEFGIGLREKQDKKDDEETKYSKDFADTHLKQKFSELQKKNKLNPTELEFVEKILDLAFDTKKKEKQYKKILEETVMNEPIWLEFLQHLKGVGLLSTAILLYYFNYCKGINYVSSLWAYSGYGVIDGEAQKHKKGVDSNFNPNLKMFMYRIGDCFIKQRSPLYRDIYDKEKARQVEMMEKKEGNYPTRLGHADARARRKMVKVFMEHYFVKCKRIIGEPVVKPYQFDKLGHKTYIDVDDFIKKIIAENNAKKTIIEND